MLKSIKKQKMLQVKENMKNFESNFKCSKNIKNLFEWLIQP